MSSCRCGPNSSVFQSTWIPIRDWNLTHLLLPSSAKMKFQSTWIPIRDWNSEKCLHLRVKARSNQHESLSGIETLLEAQVAIRSYHQFQSTWIPIRDWNEYNFKGAALPKIWVPINMNPYQGLKQPAGWASAILQNMFQSTWIPIRDWNVKPTTVSPSKTGSNQHESLSGIETSTTPWKA